MITENAIAITGTGLITALARGLEANWKELSAGRSGARTIDRFSPGELPTRFAACIRDFDNEVHTTHERTTAIARAALAEALEEAGIGSSSGSGSSGSSGSGSSGSGSNGGLAGSRLFLAVPSLEADWPARIRCARPELARGGPNGRKPEEVIADFADHAFAANALTREFGFGAPPITVTTACASGASAIQLAVDRLRSGELNLAVAAAGDSTVFPEGILRFSLLSALSTRNDDPAGACRPFCVDRDGFVMGEGGAALVLETIAHAKARGAPILGYVLGCGDATDNFHRTRSHPSGDAIVASMSRAIADARLDPGAIGYINAHGTGTPENDKMETLGITRVFQNGAAPPPVSSNKSMLGHTLSAAGAVEAVITLKSLNEKLLPPTINHHTPDPGIALDVVPNEARPADPGIALSNSFGFGGQNVSLVLAGAHV